MDEFKEIKKTYNQVASDYHKKRLDPKSSTWNNYLEAPAIESILRPLVDGKKVLDLGCGTGLLTNQIKKWGGDVNGVDLSEEMIKIAKHNINNIDFQVSKSNDLPFTDNEYDIIASSLVMHYVKDLRPSFQEMARVLNQNGELIFSMHHPFNESFNLEKFKKDGYPVVRPYFNNIHYYWRMCGAEFLSFHHTFENIIKALKSSGFVLKDMIECRPDPSLKDKFDDYEFTSQYPTFCLFHARLS